MANHYSDTGLPEATELLDARDFETSGPALERAAGLLRDGRLVAFPTETVYGLGADAFNADAVRAVFEAKGRPADNPLIVHVADASWLARCGHIDARAERLLAFMPGPLTLVVTALPVVPAIVRASGPTVALRIPAHPVALALLERSGPLVAPSANRSGRPSPTLAGHVLADLAGRIAAVIDGGPCRVGIESTVLDVSGEMPVILRPGIVSAAQIEQLLGEPVAVGADAGAIARSPGTKYRHYAPAARVHFVIAAAAPTLPASGRQARMVLTTERHREQFRDEDVRTLDAHSLYAQFREADVHGITEIVIFAGPDELDAALIDRIRRAAELTIDDL